MSDFGADTCDFHSDFASDFRTESDDYASDFRDFPGDFSGDFGGAPRPHQKPRPAWRDHADSPNQSAPAPQGPATPPRARGGARWRQAGSTPQSGNVRRAAPRHKAINKAQSGSNVGTAARIKAPYMCVKMANKAHSRKAPGIHREQRETPHSVSHAGRWSFLDFGQIEKQKNRLQQDIQQDQEWHPLAPPDRYAAFSRSVCSSSVRVLAIMSAICCWVLYRTAIPTFATSSSW